MTLGPGTGLGVAAYLPGPPAQVVAGEGGHATLAAADEAEAAVIGWLRARFGHVSAERALSGPGLVNLYRAIAERDGIAVGREPRGGDPGGARPHLPGRGGGARHVLRHAGRLRRQLALTFRSSGGVRVAGGIAPRIAPFLAASAFRERFVAKGRFRPWLERVPVAIVRHPAAALVGLAALAGEDADIAGAD